MIQRIIGSTALLFALWLIMSGHYTGLLMSLGLLSAFGVTLIAHRMNILDEEALPVRIFIRLPAASFWLISEILKSNLAVVQVILDPSLATPTQVTVNASQKTAAGLVTHANFITLTPGTVSVAVNERQKKITVHGLTEELAESCLDGSMDAKVTWIENAPS